MWGVSALTIAEKRQIELSICHPESITGAEEEKRWSSSVCAGKRSVCLQQLWGEIKVRSVVYTQTSTHTSLSTKKKKKKSNAFGVCLEHHHWLTGSREILWPSPNIKKACLYWFKSLPLNYTYCICMVLCWSLSPWHLKDFWALWIGNDWQEPLAA